MNIQLKSFAIALLGLPVLVSAQVPIATGRTITMSNSAWSMFVPTEYVQRGPVADVIFHFHGDSATFRNNAKYANLNAVIVTINYGGLSSAYQTPFQSNTNLFATIKSEALTKLRALPDFADNLAFDKEAISSFSAGYGAVREILKSPTYYAETDMLLSADTIYAGFVNYPSNKTLISSQMTDWRRFATDAKNGSKTFVLSHSQVDPVTYASTVLTANDLMSTVGVTPSAVNYNGLGTLNFYRTAQAGKFKVFGASGADGDSHLEHLRYVGEFLRELPLTKVPRPGDANFDGSVNFSDLLTLSQNYGQQTGMSWLTADFNNDQATNFSDLLLLAQNYTSAGIELSVQGHFNSDWQLARSLVPEPCLLSPAFLIVSRRRRSR